MMGEQLKMCDKTQFFEILEKCVKCRVPLQLRKILTINSRNNAIALSDNLSKIIREIEHFMRHDFTDNMLNDGETKVDFMGIWIDNQKGFQLMSCQKRMISLFVEYCSGLYPRDDAEPDDSSEVAATNSPFYYSKLSL